MEGNIDKAILNAAANVEVETGDIPKQTLKEIKEYLLSGLDEKKDDCEKEDNDGKSK